MTSLNIIPQQSTSRQPRAIVKINNSTALYINIEIDTATFYLADTFTLKLPLNGQLFPFNLNYWASSPQFQVQIFVGFPSNPENFSTADLQEIFVGDADEMEVDPLNGVVTLTGRDLTAKFIDNKTSLKFPNKTASQIITYFANARGLTPIITPTTVPVGTYYQNSQTLMTRVTSEWDLMTYLAQQSDYVIFVKGNNLIFEPYPTSQQKPYLLQIQKSQLQASPVFNGSQLAIQRSMTIAQDMIVKVRVPFSPSTKSAFTVSVTAQHNTQNFLRGLPQPTGKAQVYSYVIPGLSREQALQRAQSIALNNSQHEIIIRATLPGDNLLAKDSLIQLAGTATAFDQNYFSQSVVRNFGIDGYSMQIVAKNHSVDSQIII